MLLSSLKFHRINLDGIFCDIFHAKAFIRSSIDNKNLFYDLSMRTQLSLWPPTAKDFFMLHLIVNIVKNYESKIKIRRESARL
jgi:hypothetical protein